MAGGFFGGAQTFNGDDEEEETSGMLVRFLGSGRLWRNLFVSVKASSPSSWMSRMTQSSDREHRTPLSPVRRHGSIPRLSLSLSVRLFGTGTGELRGSAVAWKENAGLFH